jgi:nucleotide-binding universal stress UspA family protein
MKPLTARRILLASHGTRGARAAERIALGLCRSGVTLIHFIVVPDFWKGMMGDDWLNSGRTREIYGRYLETQLEDEVRAHFRRLEKQVRAKGARYEPKLSFGKPAECLLTELRAARVDLAVLGSLRPKRATGLRSRLLTEEVLRTSPAPLLIVPYPHG